MELIFGILLGAIVLTLLVAIHEFGHGIVARRNGVVVEQFGIGFPPKLYGKKIKNSPLGHNVEYTINLLPLGGFVKLQGENDAAGNKGDYGAATFWQKTKILLAGVVMNWLTAAVLFTILAAVGMPRLLPNQFVVPGDVQITKKPLQLALVEKDSPAAKAGLQQNDSIMRFAGQPLSTAKDLSRLAKENKGKTVEVIYSRSNVEHTAKVTLRDNNDDGKGFLGAGPSQDQELLRSSWSAPIVGAGLTVQLTGATLAGLGDMVVKGVSGLFMQFSPDKTASKTAKDNLGEISQNVAGPLAIYGLIFPAAERAGALYVMLFAAIISLSLAVMNILPIPALDGGRWFVTALFKWRKKPLTKELEEKIHGAGFMVLMALVVLVTIADIKKF